MKKTAIVYDTLSTEQAKSHPVRFTPTLCFSAIEQNRSRVILRVASHWDDKGTPGFESVRPHALRFDSPFI